MPEIKRYNLGMTKNRLKTLLLAVWGLFFLALAGILFIFWMQNRDTVQAKTDPDIPTLPAPQAIQPDPTTLPPTPAQRAVTTPTPLPSNTPAATIQPPLPANLPPAYNPYTGQIPTDASRLERRPMAVKITNFPRRVRGYQYGLTRADVAYEYYIEDGLSRFTAIFYGQDAEKAGPVRSGRYIDEHITRMYQSYLVFANADKRVETYLLESNLLQRMFLPTSLNCPPLCRDKSINDYNNFFVDTAGMTEYTRKIGHENVRQPARSTYFDQSPPNWSLTVDEISVRYSLYSYHTWRYDPQRRVYDRFADAVDAPDSRDEVYLPHIDVLSGEQISAENVVVLVVDHNFKTNFDREDQVFDIVLLAEGQAYIFREGRATSAIWQRDEVDQPIRLLSLGRAPLALSPGQTFYIILNPESSLEQDGTNVRFTFSIPPRYATPTATPPGFIPSPTPRRP
jgi:hypothetical protein